GAGNAKGGSVWVQLDPSFKKVEVKKESVDPEFSENDKYYLDLVDKSKTELPGAFDDIDTSPDKIDIYVKRITEKNEEYIPSSLPYTVLEADQRYSFIKDSDKASVSISIDGEKLFSAAVSDIYSHPLIISYEPASASDKEVIERYGQLTDVPAYLVNVVPAVTCGDRKTVGKKAVSLGSAQKMITDIKDGTGNTMLDDSIFAGSMYAVNLDLQTIFGDEAKLAEERLKKAEEKCTSDNSYSPEIMGALLDYAGKYYFSLCDVQIYTQALLNNIDFSRELGLAITGYEFNRHSSCGVVDSLEDGAFHIDVAYNRTNPVSFIGSRTDEKNFNAAIGAEESFLEGCVWEKLLGQDEQGISTMSVIGKAAEMDISTVIITDTNMEEELAKCNISEAVRQEIRSFVNRGMAVEAVPETLKIGDWTGTAYIAYDMTSGSASYMISGGTAGGATARFIRLVEINNVLSFMNTAMASSAIVYGLLDFQMSCLNDDIFGATRALKSAFSGSMALGSEYRMRFGIICYAIDFAIDGESALSEFEQFTVDNFNETKANYDRIRQTMDSHALSVVSKFFGCVEDAYKEYKKIERYAKTTEKAITEGDAESGFDFALMLAELISSMFKR
ncbi:MAG: hypothetical protein GXY08_03780, partial [Ruminococcus sp.]|nr:hypothetical protein [Ruminococcus sp.]